MPFTGKLLHAIHSNWLQTWRVVMFTISPTLFFLSLQVYVEIRKIVCTCSFLHGYSCTVNAGQSAMPGTAYSQLIFIYCRSTFLYTRYIIVCCKRIFVCNDRDIFIIAGYAPTINTSNWTKLKILTYTRKFSKLAIELMY